ncbi:MULTISPECIES: glycosyltransferase family 39 protein [unclassified Spirosoma]|uniref:ArnT family glycosyltransferase n=1 Tax=unclassified Spirosoma TaxID=2621999 RepID=UPI000960B4AD|nr:MULTISPECIES: glycosyltransferase family 39 protein [unclassified Spirosoma]MBN8826370.1 glycosyltransferase family 39 protein [Spirosoma sp.]OJW76116.1 MAG: glycosyl transferase [Spirosoma sp. 48-14]
MNQKLFYSLVLTVVGTLLFIPFLGGVRLFDWDEINFAECAREMIALGDYLHVHIDFKPFYEKPPLFFWLQSMMMNLFGINEFSARLPNAICGIITLVYLYNLGQKLHGHRFGLLWSLAYLGSVTPHLYFRSGIIDPFFNLFIFIGLVNLIFASWKRERLGGAMTVPKPEWTYILIGGFVLGLAILTKGPVAYLIIFLVLVTYWALNRFRWFITPFQFIGFSLAASVGSLLWYGLDIYLHGPTLVREFLAYSIRLLSTPDAGHVGFPGYHFIILLVGCFPASIFALRAFGPLFIERNYQRDFRQWMLILFWVVLVLFSIVQSKIVHYSSLCYFPLTYFAALTLSQLEDRKIQFSNWLRAGLIIVGGIFVLAVGGLPLIAHRMDIVRQFADQDAFSQGNLDANIDWPYWTLIPGIWLLIILVLVIRWYNHHEPAQASVVLFGGMAVFITLTLWAFIGRIEGISQAAAMRFFERAQGQNVYVKTYGYHSYGPFFYTMKPPVTNPNAYNDDWLLHGKIDKDVLFIRHASEQPTLLDSLPDVKKTGQENGFVFYRRQAK